MLSLEWIRWLAVLVWAFAIAGIGRSMQSHLRLARELRLHENVGEFEQSLRARVRSHPHPFFLYSLTCSIVALFALAIVAIHALIEPDAAAPIYVSYLIPLVNIGALAVGVLSYTFVEFWRRPRTKQRWARRTAVPRLPKGMIEIQTPESSHMMSVSSSDVLGLYRELADALIAIKPSSRRVFIRKRGNLIWISLNHVMKPTPLPEDRHSESSRLADPL